MINQEYEIELYFIDIKCDISDSDYARCVNLISRDKKEKLDKFRMSEDRKRSLYGDILVRYLAMQKLGLSNEELIFRKNDYGKPFLCGDHNFHYNISHSGRFILCGISSNEIGVDIEQIMPIGHDIAKRFFTEREYTSLLNLDDLSFMKLFYTYWTLKESYIKYKGKGLSIPLDSFSFSQKGKEYVLNDELEDIKFKSRLFYNDHMIAIAYKGDGKERVEAKHLNICNILEKFG